VGLAGAMTAPDGPRGKASKSTCARCWRSAIRTITAKYLDDDEKHTLHSIEGIADARVQELTIIPFSFEAFPVRTIMRNGEPWFVLADACRVLEITNTGNALARLDDDEKADIRLMDARSGQHRLYALISESGLYSLILRSEKPKAREFKKWVTSTVLPSIRKTGSYGVIDPMVALQTEAAVLAPKAAALDWIATADGSLCLQEAAKALQIGPGGSDCKSASSTVFTVLDGSVA
jgi:prophage antirepressor-like protein